MRLFASVGSSSVGDLISPLGLIASMSFWIASLNASNVNGVVRQSNTGFPSAS